MNKFIIGITGPSGAGKTSICEMFKENGFYIINADKVYASIIVEGKECYKKIVDFFGERILDKNNNIDRKKLSRIVFNNKKKLEMLNSIAHKYVVIEIEKQIKLIYNENNRIILDVPLLFESGCDKLCFKTVAVVCEQKIMVKRIMKRDNLDLVDATLRVRNQKNNEFYIKKTDYVINNNSLDIDMLKSNVINIIKDIVGE